jgi:hypothetical protein
MPNPKHYTLIATLAKSIGCTARRAPDGSLRVLIPTDTQLGDRIRRIRGVCADLHYHCTHHQTSAHAVWCLRISPR